MIFSYHGASLQNSLSWGIRRHTKTLRGRVTLKTIMPDNTELPWDDNGQNCWCGTFAFSFPDSFEMLLTCRPLRISNAHLLTLFQNKHPSFENAIKWENLRNGQHHKVTICRTLSFDPVGFSGRKAAHVSQSQQLLSEVGDCQLAQKKAHTRFPDS